MSDDTTLDILLWIVLPYFVLAIFILGHVWRFRTDQYTVTSRSSQLYESKLLRFGSPLFHYGIIAVFFGHLMGLLIPQRWTDAIGITESMYHWGAFGMGIVASAVTAGGIMILAWRRTTNDRVKTVTPVGDKIMFGLLGLSILLGILATLFNLQSSYNYREGLSIWFRNFWTLNPDASLMASAPLFFQLHVLIALVLFAIWPFSRLVHAFTIPFGYLNRPYILYRSRDDSERKPRPGWAKSDIPEVPGPATGGRRKKT